MCDTDEAIYEMLKDVEYSIGLILERFENIKVADDFLSCNDNITMLDSISMRILAIGEAFKNIDKLSNQTLLQKYPTIEWKKIKGTRDILSHHYFDINADIIFSICDEKLDDLLEVTKQMIADIKRDKC